MCTQGCPALCLCSNRHEQYVLLYCIAFAAKFGFYGRSLSGQRRLHSWVVLIGWEETCALPTGLCLWMGDFIGDFAFFHALCSEIYSIVLSNYRNYRLFEPHVYGLVFSSIKLFFKNTELIRNVLRSDSFFLVPELKQFRYFCASKNSIWCLKILEKEKCSSLTIFYHLIFYFYYAKISVTNVQNQVQHVEIHYVVICKLKIS